MRPTVNLRINGGLLRRLIKNKSTINAISSEIGTSRQTIHGWFSKGLISPIHFSMLVKVIGLSADEVKALNRSEITVEERLVIKNREYRQTLEKIRDQIDELLNRLET